MKREILLIIFIVKSLQIYNYEPQSAGINMQSPQNESTSRRLTLIRTGDMGQPNILVPLIRRERYRVESGNIIPGDLKKKFSNLLPSSLLLGPYSQ